MNSIRTKIFLLIFTSLLAVSSVVLYIAFIKNPKDTAPALYNVTFDVNN